MPNVITLQGTLPIGSTIIYQVPVKSVSTVSGIKMYNPLAYDITLSQYKDSIASLLDIYSLVLAAGDSITDTYTYRLSENDYLEVTTAVAGTNYFITVIQDI